MAPVHVRLDYNSNLVLMLWRESLQKKRCLTVHCVTKPTFDDVMCAIEGCMLYLLKCASIPEADVVPWLFTSDGCEQMFALRIGRYKGQQTNLDVKRVIEGLQSCNRSLELD